MNSLAYREGHVCGMAKRWCSDHKTVLSKTHKELDAAIPDYDTYKNQVYPEGWSWSFYQGIQDALRETLGGSNQHLYGCYGKGCFGIPIK